MKKILFISLAIVLALSVGLIGCEGEGPEPPEVWDSTITLTLHPTISGFSSIVKKAINPWIAAVEAIKGDSGGNFSIEVVTPGDSPYDAASSLAAISIGTTDIGMLSPETFHLGGAGYLPFEFDSIEECAYVMYKLWTADPTWDANGQLDGVKILTVIPLWGSQLWTNNLTGSANVTVAGDMDGLQIRSDAQVVESATIQALGASPNWIGVSDLVTSLQSNDIQGCFFTYSGIGGAANLGNPTTVFTTELDMIYRPYSLAMCKDVWDALPTEAQTALEEAIGGVDNSVAYATMHLTGEAADRADTEADRAPGGIYVADKSTFITATEDVADEWAAWLESEDGPGLDGTGILAAIATLKAEYP